MYSRSISENINYKSWCHREKPKKILAIRLQALGDVVITLPYLQSLKAQLPGTQFDFLCREEVDDLPRNLDLFDHVFSIGGGRSVQRQFLSAIRFLPQLRAQHYDVVVDLQRNPLSRWIRKLLQPSSWSEFDRFSPLSAGERNRLTIEALRLGPVDISQELNLKNKFLGLDILESEGWDPECDLIVLNPAGCFPTKNWPLEYYVDFARLWLNEYREYTQFLVLGVDTIFGRAQYLQEQLDRHLINLVNRTTPAEAFAIIQKVNLVLSDDSGLMHMAWAARRPTVALFGSSRSNWSAPLGDFSVCLNSADLPCGECMEEVCRYGDVHCLTRYTPPMVFKEARTVFEKSKRWPVETV